MKALDLSDRPTFEPYNTAPTPFATLLNIPKLISTDIHLNMRQRRPIHILIRTNKFTRMHHIKENHNTKHKHSIKNINIKLLHHQFPIMTALELRNSEDGTDENERTGSVKAVHVFHPWGDRGLGCGGNREPFVEDGASDHEDSEHDYLDGETGEDNYFAGALGAGFGHHGAAWRGL
jgi:hypothetical protein